MNIRELNAGLVAFGGCLTTLFGSTIMVNKHTVTLMPNGNVNVDHHTVGKVTSHTEDDEKVALIQQIASIVR